MTVRNWLKQFEHYSYEELNKEILIECLNGILVDPHIKRKMKNPVNLLDHSIENIEAYVITP